MLFVGGCDAGSCGCVLESSSASTLEECKAQQFGNYDMLSTIHFYDGEN